MSLARCIAATLLMLAATALGTADVPNTCDSREVDLLRRQMTVVQLLEAGLEGAALQDALSNDALWDSDGDSPLLSALVGAEGTDSERCSACQTEVSTWLGLGREVMATCDAHEILAKFCPPNNMSGCTIFTHTACQYKQRARCFNGCMAHALCWRYGTCPTGSNLWKCCM